LQVTDLPNHADPQGHRLRGLAPRLLLVELHQPIEAPGEELLIRDIGEQQQTRAGETHLHRL
jgi:hypothetical protein